MRPRYTTVVACSCVAIAVATLGCASRQSLRGTPATLGAEEREILAARTAQNQAIAANDADRVAAFWTEDVELRRGLGQLVVGRAAYRQLFADSGNRDSALVYQREPTRIESSTKWPLAFESGTWTGHLGRVDGPIVIRGQYGAQWVKRAGRWLIRGEVFVALTCADVGCTYSAAP
jgi:ketosteroid isomerase-like protein